MEASTSALLSASRRNRIRASIASPPTTCASVHAPHLEVEFVLDLRQELQKQSTVLLLCQLRLPPKTNRSDEVQLTLPILAALSLCHSRSLEHFR